MTKAELIANISKEAKIPKVAAKKPSMHLRVL